MVHATPAGDDVALVLRRFPGLRVLVVGDAILDAYLDGHSERLCREAPVPVVEVDAENTTPGGAANTALNVAALGARTSYVAVTGHDEAGRLLAAHLSSAGVDVSGVLVQPDRRTIAKRRVLASSQMLLRLDDGDTSEVDEATGRRVATAVEARWSDADAVIVSDYGYGLVTQPVVETLRRLQRTDPKVLVVDSRSLPVYRDVGVTAVKPNYRETMRLLGDGSLHDQGDTSRAAKLGAYGERVLDITGARIAAVTLDTEGSLVFERGCPPHRTYARPMPDSKAAGAGDTFTSALTLSLAAGAHTHTAAEVASAATAVVVERDGTTACSLEELYARFESKERAPLAMTAAERIAREERREGRTVVLAVGCFDILHRGHIDFLNRAKALGDVLVVGLNSDESVQRLRGEGRPLNPLDDRVRVLSALSCVDHIVAFEQETAERLVAAVRPDVFVKGADHEPSTLPESAAVREIGGRIEILPLLTPVSTSSVIRRIRDAEEREAGTVG